LMVNNALPPPRLAPKIVIKAARCIEVVEKFL